MLESLPVHGYQPQSTSSVDKVNVNKIMEEEILRRLDELKMDDAVDGRWLQIGRTYIEQAFMAINRSIFKPERIALPRDEQPETSSDDIPF